MRKTYPEVGRCIYCGATSYAPDSNRFLAREHIIPEALSGGLELPRASCRSCERKINKWEAMLLRGSLLGCRTYLDLETKRPKDRPRALPLFRPGPDPNPKVMIPIEDYPANLMLMAFDTPRLLSGAATLSVPWMHIFRDVAQLLADRYGLAEFAIPSLDPYALCRMLAKIAHAYTVAELGLDGFVPLLPHLIVGPYEGWDRFYVGGLHDIEPAGESLHEIAVEPVTAETWRYVVVRIRLFASVPAPTYRVVSGFRLSSAKPAEVPPAVGGVPRSFDRTPAVEELAPPIPQGLWDPTAPSANVARGPFERVWFRARSNYRPTS